MNSQSFIVQLQNVFYGLSYTAIFWATLSAIIINFIVCLTIALLRRDLIKKIRVFYILITFAVACFSTVFALLKSDGITALICMVAPVTGVGLSVLFFLPFVSINGAIKVNDKHKNLISKLDAVIKSEDTLKPDQPEFIPERIRKFSAGEIKENTGIRTNLNKEPAPSVAPEVDFSHVRNVMERLDYYGLSQTDRNVIKELKLALNLAESSGLDDNLKSKINDGLGQLLKIMSKYNV